jgi:endonuclease/exonuclease/phosphatase (EEP) superfamily protein YafD
MIVLRIFLYIISIAHLISILLALIKKDFWVFRIFDYPRMQKFVILVVVTILLVVFFGKEFVWADWLLVSLLLLSLIYLASLIIPFTAMGRPMIRRVEAGNKAVLKLLVANVFQDNTDFQKLLNLIKKNDPDIIFLLETDLKWKDQMQPLKERYPYSIEVPKDNTYGLLFYSKLKMLSHDVNYLIDPEIPSIVADIEFNEQLVKIFGLHPTPPSPSENLYSTERDAEILMVAKTVAKMDQPCLVIGDLNDVAWSYTTELFLKTSGLLDPRRGRGWYNTYNANYVVFRWPLDHYFVSGHFRLIELKREEHIGSDHFPISISLCLDVKDESGRLYADAEDKKLANKKIADAGAGE